MMMTVTMMMKSEQVMNAQVSFENLTSQDLAQQIMNGKAGSDASRQAILELVQRNKTMRQKLRKLNLPIWHDKSWIENIRDIARDTTTNNQSSEVSTQQNVRSQNSDIDINFIIIIIIISFLINSSFFINSSFLINSSIISSITISIISNIIRFRRYAKGLLLIAYVFLGVAIYGILATYGILPLLP